jgi:hypothetical protein
MPKGGSRFMHSARHEETKSGTGGASPFRAAFAEARREATRTLGAADDAAVEDAWAGARFETRIQKRLGSRSRDQARWNELGRSGWELVAVNGKHAFFRRVFRANGSV